MASYGGAKWNKEKFISNKSTKAFLYPSSFSLFFKIIIDFFLGFFYSDCEVFPKNHPAPFSKVLTFFRKEPFALEAYYNNPKELPYPSTSLGTAESTSLRDDKYGR